MFKIIRFLKVSAKYLYVIKVLQSQPDRFRVFNPILFAILKLNRQTAHHVVIVPGNPATNILFPADGKVYQTNQSILGHSDT